MITALISSVLGMVGGLIPDIFKEVRESREHSRELERMDRTADLQLKMLEAQTEAKLAEIDSNLVVEEMKAFSKQMENIYSGQKPINIPFVDAFNALIRPSTASLIMLMFVVTASFYIFGAVGLMKAGDINIFTAAEVIWTSMIGEAIQAVLGYLFGYRSTKSAIRRIRPA
ncbi:MAG: hypothetical protein ABJN40_13095 [Sneathiella sp.]